ncbi:MAG: ABC transporter permease [bacterium]
MLKNYIIIACRNLIKHRFYSAINVFGLAIGITTSLLFLLFVWNVLTYDSFHKNRDDIYFLYRLRPSPEGTLTVFDTWVPTVPEMRKAYADIVDGTRFFNVNDWVKYGDKRFQESLDFVDAGLFNMFSFPLLKGDPATALTGKNSIVISEAMAVKYFGNEDPLGKVLQIGGEDQFTVTGVAGRIPANSTFTFDFMMPFENAMDIPFVREAGWSSSFLYSFVQIQKGADPGKLEAQFPQFVNRFFDENAPEKVIFKLMPLRQVNNAFTSMDKYAYICLGMVLAILAIAAINFTNLAIARSLSRSREIGMRKVLGAERAQLIHQFLGESMLTTLIALILGMMLAELLLPEFNRLTNMQLELSYFKQVDLFFGLILLWLVAGIAAGAYPAFFLSRFKPIQSLKTQLNISGRTGGLRNGLVVAQFALSVILIIGAGIVYQQIDFMKGHNLRFDQENVAVISTPNDVFENPEDGPAKYRSFREELQHFGGIQALAGSSVVPGRYRGSFTLARPEGWDQAQQLDWRFSYVDDNYFNVYGIEILAGRNFSEERSTDESEAVIINEAAKKVIGWPDPVGKKLFFDENSRTIIGVVKDFHYQSLANPIQPVLHYYRNPHSGSFRFLSVKIRHHDLQAVLAQVREKWQALIPGEMQYFLVADNFRTLYRTEETLGLIATYSSFLAMVIACLGLFGLASYSVVQRAKEIGIRKVLGASLVQLLALITKDFFKLITCANLIAWPVGYFIMKRWLAEYPYRVNLGVEIFLLTALAAFMIAFLTVSFQALRAALANPVEALRYE